jgi:hypothetical protein
MQFARDPLPLLFLCADKLLRKTPHFAFGLLGTTPGFECMTALLGLAALQRPDPEHAEGCDKNSEYQRNHQNTFLEALEFAFTIVNLPLFALKSALTELLYLVGQIEYVVASWYHLAPQKYVAQCALFLGRPRKHRVE